MNYENKYDKEVKEVKKVISVKDINKATSLIESKLKFNKKDLNNLESVLSVLNLDDDNDIDFRKTIIYTAITLIENSKADFSKELKAVSKSKASMLPEAFVKAFLDHCNDLLEKENISLYASQNAFKQDLIKHYSRQISNKDLSKTEMLILHKLQLDKDLPEATRQAQLDALSGNK